jgi:hypothetical protein
MKTSGNPPQKITAGDPFDYQLFLRGVANQILQMNSNVYEFAYYFTFKRTRKDYANEFNDPYDMPIDQEQFFLETGDPVVINCCEVTKKICLVKREILKLLCIEEFDNDNDPIADLQSARYAPYRLTFKRSKNYKKLKMAYERALVAYLEYAYTVACAITASKYRIPQILKKQYLLDDTLSLRLLNSDNPVVDLLIDMIIGLRVDLAALRAIGVKKPKNCTH